MRIAPVLPAATIAAALLVASALPAVAQQTRMGLHAGFNPDGNDVFLGLNGHFGVTVADRDAIIGVTAELYPFLDHETITVVEMDALLLGHILRVDLYGGGGLTLRAIKLDVPADSNIDDSDTAFGFNVKAGMIFRDEYSSMRPFLEVDQSIGAGSNISARLGVFFTIGA